MADDSEYQTGDSGASNTYPQQCSALRKNGHVVIKGKPCKIVEMSTSKTGKHGHAKVHLIGVDIFTGKKLEDICPSTHNMNVPHVKREDYQFVDIADGFLCLINDGGGQKDDIRFMPDTEVGKEIQKKQESDEGFNVTILSAMGNEKPIAVKSMKDQ